MPRRGYRRFVGIIRRQPFRGRRRGGRRHRRGYTRRRSDPHIVETGPVTGVRIRSGWTTEETSVSLLFDEPNVGKPLIWFSLILSNLPSLTPVLADPQVCPSRSEVKDLRRYFQYFATARPLQRRSADRPGPSASHGPTEPAFAKNCPRYGARSGTERSRRLRGRPDNPKTTGWIFSPGANTRTGFPVSC